MPFNSRWRNLSGGSGGCGATRPSFANTCPAPSSPVSPPSNNILMTTQPASLTSQGVYTINSDGSGLTALVSIDTTGHHWSRWSADGTNVIWYPDSSPETFAASSPGSRDAFWPGMSGWVLRQGPGDASPDFTHAVMPGIVSSTIGLIVFDGITGTATATFISKPDADATQVLWIPDDSGFSYQGVSIAGGDEVHTCALDGSSDVTVLSDRTGCWSWIACDWYWDSSCFLVFWINRDSGAQQLWRVSADGTKGTLLYDDEAGSVLNDTCALSPDQSTIVMADSGNLYTMPATGGSWTEIYTGTSSAQAVYVDW